MDINLLIQTLTDGLPADQAAVVKAAIERDAVKTKAAGWKQESEFQTIQADAQRLKQELEGGPDKPGAKAYQEWYNKNFTAVQTNYEAIQKFEAKYGQGSFAKAAAGEFTPTAVPQNPPPTVGNMSKEEVQRLLDERFQSVYSNGIASVLKNTGSLVQKHMYAGRKNPIDFEALDKIMGEKKYSLDQAYDEWDRPEREKAQKEAEEKRIDERVKEELQKRGASSNFSAGADFTPGALAAKTRDQVEKFDKTALMRDLAKDWVTQ